MVERLKDAINKARETRERAVEQPPPPPVDRPQIAKPENELRDAMLAAVTRGPSAPQARQRTPVAEAWQALEEIQLNPTKLDKNRIISHKKSNPAHLSFDMLRTRILNMLRKHGWSRLAITSPTKGCGKSTVAVNLALSLGHQNDMRSMLFDVDMRAPSLAKYMDVRERLAMADFCKARLSLKPSCAAPAPIWQLALTLKPLWVQQSCFITNEPSKSWPQPSRATSQTWLSMTCRRCW